MVSSKFRWPGTWHEARLWGEELTSGLWSCCCCCWILLGAPSLALRSDTLCVLLGNSCWLEDTLHQKERKHGAQGMGATRREMKGISKVMMPVDPEMTAWSRPRGHPGDFGGRDSVSLAPLPRHTHSSGGVLATQYLPITVHLATIKQPARICRCSAFVSPVL